jgi:hypothetical protein
MRSAELRWPLTLAAAALFALGGCNKAPAEPERGASSAAPPAVAPLAWDVPGSWAKLDVPSATPKKAAYQVNAAGDDKESATVDVFFYGTGAKGDPAAIFKEWFDQFDGDVGATATHEAFEVHGLKVETVETTGTYKIALTPPPRGKRVSPVQMVKNKWRIYGAVVRTTDRGNWFFKLTGPDESVQAGKSQFRALLDSAR